MYKKQANVCFLAWFENNIPLEFFLENMHKMH